VSMTGSYPKAEILTGPERRRRWTVAEKLSMVAETREPGVTVSLVARRRGVSPSQLFTWRRLAEQGALTATQAEEEVVPASAFRAQQEQIRELQRLLGKKTLENEILKEALDIAATESKKRTLRSLSLPKDRSLPRDNQCRTHPDGVLGRPRAYVGWRFDRRR
jgi:transposase